MKSLNILIILVIFSVNLAFCGFTVDVPTTFAPLPKLYPRGTVLPDGTGLIYGGNPFSAEIFDPATKTFNSIEFDNGPQLYAPAIAANGWLVYIFGGLNSTQSGDRKNTVYECNVTATTCKLLTTSSSPPSVRTLSAMVYYNRSLFIHGGGAGSSKPSDETWQFEIASATWTKLADSTSDANSPNARVASTATLYNNQMILIGGLRSGPGEWYDDVHILDLDIKKWLTPPTARSTVAHGDHVSALAGDYILVYAGNTNNGDLTTVLDIYHIPTQTWNASLTNTEGVGLAAITGFYVNDIWYLYGGTNGNDNNVNSLDIYAEDGVSTEMTSNTDTGSPSTMDTSGNSETANTIQPTVTTNNGGTTYTQTEDNDSSASLVGASIFIIFLSFFAL